MMAGEEEDTKHHPHDDAPDKPPVPEDTPITARSPSRREQYPSSLFTNDDGNLKFVALVVRHPCKVFFAILVVNLIAVMILFQSFSEAPFSDPGSQYDTKDIRSLSYDSLRLAQDEVEDLRDERRRRLLQKPPHQYLTGRDSSRHLASRNKRRQLQTTDDASIRIQEQGLDFTYWVYEAEDEDIGLFGSAASIAAMKESQELYLQDAAYEDFCWREYFSIDNSTTSKCRLPLTPLNIYYNSQWDSEIANYIIAELSNEDNIQRYNDLSICVEFNLLCDNVPESYDADDFAWTNNLNKNITALTDKWDGTGELVEANINEITTLVAHLMQLVTKRGFVDFGFDKGFSLDNPVSLYSRAVFTWGGPLAQSANADVETEDDREDLDEDTLKDYFVDNFLDKMNEISETGHDPNVNSYYFMGVLILEVLLDIVTRDAMLAIASFVFVFLYLRVTVGSWFLSVVGMTEIMLSVPVSWFIYKFVFQIKYFAFLNTLSLFIVAAIGADDIFIFMDAYKQSAHSHDPEILESLESRMSWVYRRTGTAMAITSATTCAAFLCTLVTPLVDIRSFGIFAAIVIFIDYVLVMTLFCTAVVIYHNKFERPGCCGVCSAGCRTADPSSTDTARESIGDGDPDEQGDKISRFFRNQFSPFIWRQSSRIIIAVVFIAWIVVAVIYASQLEPTKEAEQFLRDDHPLQKSITILNNEFPTSQDDIGLEVFFAWGLDQVDRSGVNQLVDPEFLGKPVFVEDFEFNEQCQTELLNACSTLRTSDEYRPHIKQENGFGTVSCFVEEFAAFSVLGSLEDCRSVVSGTWRTESWQVPAEDVASTMASFVGQRSCYSEEGLSILNEYSDEIGWDGTRLRFAAIALESSVVDPFSTLPEETVRTEYDKMIEISKELDTSIGQACGGSVIMTDLESKFVFMNNQRIYSISAVQSSLLGVGIAFAVLLLATRVFHIAVLATFSIGCVLVSVTGAIAIIGWQLGSIESVLISIVAGFAVDYVVHLSHSYVLASGDTQERITTAFGEMGISVLNGMVTSVCASIPLFLCQLTFFRKFGTFMFLTIAFSWLFANFAFMSALAQLKLPVRLGNSKEEQAEASPEESAVEKRAEETTTKGETAAAEAPPIAASNSEEYI